MGRTTTVISGGLASHQGPKAKGQALGALDRFFFWLRRVGLAFNSV
jgi:hypothetical protein